MFLFWESYETRPFAAIHWSPKRFLIKYGWGTEPESLSGTSSKYCLLFYWWLQTFLGEANSRLIAENGAKSRYSEHLLIFIEAQSLWRRLTHDLKLHTKWRKSKKFSSALHLVLKSGNQNRQPKLVKKKGSIRSAGSDSLCLTQTYRREKKMEWGIQAWANSRRISLISTQSISEIRFQAQDLLL